MDIWLCSTIHARHRFSVQIATRKCIRRVRGFLCGRVKKRISRSCRRNIPRGVVSESGGGGPMSFVISLRGIGVCVSWMGVLAAPFIRGDLLSGLCKECVPNSSTSAVEFSIVSMSSPYAGDRPLVGLDRARATFFMFFTGTA